jgi:hypothetical protein
VKGKAPRPQTTALLVVPLWLFTLAPGYGQTGPGGVGNTSTVVLWLSADHGVEVGAGAVLGWNDRSGNGHVASQGDPAKRPAFVSSGFNGLPSIRFDNSQTDPDVLQVMDHPTLKGMTALTGFSVHDLLAGTTEGAPRAILAKRNGVSAQNDYAWFHWNGGSGSTIRQYLDINGTNQRLASTLDYVSGSPFISTFLFNGAAASGQPRHFLYRRHQAAGNRTSTTTAVPSNNADLYIGYLNGHPGTGTSTSRFNGHISELILMNVRLGEAQRIIVDNYLSAKYGLLLEQRDLYTMDDPDKGDHDHDVAGIGRINATDLHDNSRGTGIIQISNPSDLDDGEFLFWGHDGGILGTFGVPDLPVGVEGRWLRTWRVSEVDLAGAPVDVGAVDITLDLGDFPGTQAEHLRLLVDPVGNGSFANGTIMDGALDMGNGLFQFQSVTALTHGSRFTLGTSNLAVTPLPVSLVSFSAHADGAGPVTAQWTTASERNSAFFEVQRSADLASWDAAGTVAAAGHSDHLLHYSFLDHQAPWGTVYYRLAQHDHDGQVNISTIVPVERGMATAPRLYPNPAVGHVNMDCQGCQDVFLKVTDIHGRTVIARAAFASPPFTLDIRSLPPGTYLVHLSGAASSHVERLVVTSGP